MPNTPKVLGQAAPATTTDTALYTVPAATSTVVATGWVCNTSSTADTFRISVIPSGQTLATKNYLYYGVTVNGNDTFCFTLGLGLQAGDTIHCYSTNGTTTVFGCTGVEVT